MTSMLEAALWYHKKGFNIIPAKPSKKPFVKWADFQKKRADENQIRQWWQKWPRANIAIITGAKSNLTVIDADNEEAYKSVQEFISDSLLIPTVKTPHGWHYYFQFVSGLSNGVRVLGDCDIRSEGGYVVAPPSSNGSAKKYAWLDGLHISNVQPPAMPSMLLDVLLQFVGSTSSIALSNNSNKMDSNSSSNARACVPLYNAKSNHNIKEQQHNNHNVDLKPSKLIPVHERDNTFFHLANHLVKSGMKTDNIRFFLQLFLYHCTEQEPGNKFTKSDVEAKINSAIQRANSRDKISMGEIRDWVSITEGNFSITEASQSLTIITKPGKQKLRVYLSRLVNEGIIERVPPRDGVFRKIISDLPKINILKEGTGEINIKLPLELHEYYRPMQKNIIIVAGTQDVGKTAFMLNVARINMNRNWDIRYCTSEMGPMELKSRLKMFEPDVPLAEWSRVDFREVSTNFKDAIIPNGLNIIDYFEISDSFYKIGQFFKGIYDRLEKGIAVIALQKDFKSELGRGGSFSLEKPRLYITLTANPPEGNVAKIVKCKNWARQDINPNHLECVFKIIKGSRIKMQIGWALPGKLLKEV